jgi:hypothetical protein
MAEGRLDRLSGAGLRGFGSSVEFGARGQAVASEVRAWFRHQSEMPTPRRFAELEMDLPAELVGRIRNVDPEVVSRRLGEAAERALKRAIPSLEGVCGVRPGQRDSVRVVGLVSYPAWMQPKDATTAMARLDRAWRTEVYRAVDLRLPSHEGPRSEKEQKLLEAWLRANAKCRSAVADRLWGKGSPNDVVAALSAVREASKAYQQFLSQGSVASPLLSGLGAAGVKPGDLSRADRETPRIPANVVAAQPAVEITRELTRKDIVLPSAASALQRFPAEERDRALQRAMVAAIPGFQGGVLSSRVSGTGVIARVITENKDHAALLDQPLPIARITNRLAEIAAGPTLTPRAQEAASSASIRAVGSAATKEIPGGLYLANTRGVLEHLPEAQRLRAVQEAVDRVVPDLRARVVSVRALGIGSSLDVDVMLPDQERQTRFMRGMFASAIEKELTSGRLVPGIAGNVNEAANGVKEVAKGVKEAVDGVKEAAKGAVSVAAEAGKTVASEVAKAPAAPVRPVIDAVQQAAEHSLTVAKTGLDVIKQGGDAHAIAHGGWNLMLRAVPPVLSQTIGRAVQRAGQELIDLTRGRE